MEARGDPSWIALVLAGVALMLVGYAWSGSVCSAALKRKRHIAAGGKSFADDLMAYRPYFFLGVGVLMAVAGIIVGVTSLTS